MKNLSSDIEIAINNSIDGMTKRIEIVDVDDDKLERLVKSRQESFVSIKEMLGIWQNSPNAPSSVKLIDYTKKLIKAGETTSTVLREALRKEIDFDELDVEKFGQAIRSKPVIYRALNEINSGIKILEKQIETSTIDFKTREFKPSFPERFANQEFFPDKDYYKKWYDEENDCIILDPKGTVGEILVLDGLRVALPKPPANKKNIAFHRLPKEQQYWRRQEMPKGLTPDNEEEYSDYILEEYRRRKEGFWFFNNGKPTWVTPAHYMGLQWNEMLETGGYKDFRYAQASMYYHALACMIDPRSVGMIFCKGRRSGFTEMALDHFVHYSTSVKNKAFGITSKTEADAVKAFTKYSYAIRNLPFFFQPVVKGKIDDVKKMEFGKPSDNSKTAKQKRDTSTNDYLNVIVDFRATATLAYDSTALFLYLGDEASKWERPNNYEDHWNNIKPTMVQGGNVVGKALIGSTVNALERGGKEFQNLFYGSDVTQRNPNGRTTTGLYSYFLPAHKNYETFTDIYGVCHDVVLDGDSFVNFKGEKKTIGALQYLENEFASARKMGGKYLNNTRRLDPVTLDDAFRDEIQEQLFDVEKITQQIIYNKNVRIDEKLVRGNFYWKNNEPDTEVIWRPEERGRFLVYWIPPEEMRNKFTVKPTPFGLGGFTKFPLFEEVGAFGCDPYDQVAVVDSKLVATENGTEYNLGSKGALHGLTGFNLTNAPSNTFFLEYIARPKDSEMFFEDVLMACVFYSMPILVENNKKMLLYHFKNRGYRGYSINRMDKQMDKLSPDEKLLGGIPNNSPDIINRHWTGIETYVNNHVGEYVHEGTGQRLREEGEIGDMPFIRTLSDWLKFNVKDRTKFDASISSGLAIMAVNRNNYKKVEEKKPFTLSIKKYDNYAGRH
jgi:hypothetical protein